MARSARWGAVAGATSVVAIGAACGGTASVARDSEAKLSPLPDGGSVTVTIDATQRFSTVRTGGGSVFTGFVNYVEPDHTGAQLLSAMPYRLNRVHFSGEVPDASFRTQDRLGTQFPQPSPPPAPWDFEWSDGPVKLAKQIRDAGGPDFIMSIHNAPTWMTASGDPGTKPASNDDYATYCARIVAYYNKGSFVDDAGRVVVNPAGVTGIRYWEVWNEPDINDFGGGASPVFSPTEFAEMFQTVSAAMRAVDPTIQIGGPNSISDVDDTFTYASTLLSSGAKVDFVTYHQYQASSSMSDERAFTVASTLYSRPDTSLPVVISETNTDSEDNQSRTGSPFEWAAMPLEYKAHIEAGTWRVIRWETYEKNYDLVDATTGLPRTTYWAERTFWEAMREGTIRIACSSSSVDVDCIATVDAAGNIAAAIINRGVSSSTEVNGTGVRHSVDVVGAPGTYALSVVDRNTDPAVGPSGSVGAPLGIVIDGYGIATIVQRAAPDDGGGAGDASVDVGDATDAGDTDLPDSSADVSSGDATSSPDAGASVIVACNALTLESGALNGSSDTACTGESPSLSTADGDFVEWSPATPPTSAYATFTLPSTTPPSSLQLVVAYRGDDATEAPWAWYARNDALSWDLVGDDAWAADWAWTTHVFTIATPSRYVDANGQVRVRFTSAASTNSAEIDEMYLVVTY